MAHASSADSRSHSARIDQLLHAARAAGGDALGQLLQVYRNYLTILATTQLDRRLQRRVSPSDLVQEAMLAAHRDFQQFRGQSEREFIAWLRQILIHCWHHAIEQHVRSRKRDVRCEVAIERVNSALDQSALALAEIAIDPGPSPSAALARRENAVAIADLLARLKPEYRDVIVLRNLQGLSFDEIAERLGRQSGAVRMLWLRAIDKFKQVCETPS